MPEFRVRDEHAVVDHGAADSGAEGGQQHQTIDTLGGAVAMLGHAGGIRVVHEVDVATEALFEELLRLEPDPPLGDVRRGHRPAGGTIAGKHTPTGASGSMLPSCANSSSTVSTMASGSPPSGVASFTRSLTSVPLGDVDDRTLDSGATDVDAYCRRGHAHVLGSEVSFGDRINPSFPRRCVCRSGGTTSAPMRSKRACSLQPWIAPGRSTLGKRPPGPPRSSPSAAAWAAEEAREED